MTKYKVGDEITDKYGWREVTKVHSDGYVEVLDQEGEDSVFYNKENDITLEKNDVRGIIVKLSYNKNFRGYTVKYFNNRSIAEYWVKTEVDKTKPKKLYYRIEDGVVTKCPICKKNILKSEGCARCEKLRV